MLKVNGINQSKDQEKRWELLGRKHEACKEFKIEDLWEGEEICPKDKEGRNKLQRLGKELWSYK